MRNEGDKTRFAWLAEGNEKQARKRVSTKGLVRDERGRILLVNPNYKEHWDLPGGMAEANESPRAALEREIAEELAVNLAIGRLLTLDWVGPHGPWDDQLVFVFDSGTLTQDTIGKMQITDSEISDFDFFPLNRAKELLRDDIGSRLQRAVDQLRTDRTHYAETRRPDHAD